MQFAWLTDIHLNFCDDEQIEEFLGRLRDSGADAFLVGGDIGEAPSLIGYLKRIDDALRKPLYFVLGNHDFYRGSIGEVRRDVEQLCQQRPTLCYLSIAKDPIELKSGVGLVGHDGWADARAGDYMRSEISLNDYRLIAELISFDKAKRLPVLRALADAAAEHIRKLLPAALDLYEHVYLLTHVPPLREACWHEGRLSDDDWAPHFTCLTVGQAILEIMAEYPRRTLTVLCGHTHSEGECRPSENVEILTGGADYGWPKVQRLLRV